MNSKVNQHERELSRHLSTKKLRQHVLHFVEGLGSKSPETRGTYLRALRQFLSWTAADGHFRFRVDDVERYKGHLAAKELSEASVSTYLTALRQLCERLVAIGLLQENPARSVGGSRRPMNHSRKALSYADVEKLIDSIDSSTHRGMRDYAMIKTMLGCGLSEIEMIRADVGDLRRRGSEWVLFVQGKGRVVKDQPVPVPEDVKTAIDEYLNTRREVSRSDALFLSAGNKVRGKRMSTRGIRERVNYYLNRAGIKQDRARRITPFSLRHTAALMLVDAGATPEEVKERFRLGSLATAMIYMKQKGSLRKT